MTTHTHTLFLSVVEGLNELMMSVESFGIFRDFWGDNTTFTEHR